jgi:hypothetical protein
MLALGANADRAGARRPQVAQDVAEQVGRGHHVEALRLHHEARRQDVDVLLVPRNVGVARRNFGAALVPPRHRDRDAVALGGQGQRLARPRARQLERKLQQPLAADAREDRRLRDEFALGARVHHAAHRRVLAFRVFAHDHHVDVARLAARQRARHAVEQARRPQVDVLVEVAPELDQRAPQRDVVGHGRRPAHRTEEQRVHAFEPAPPVVGHHLAVLREVVAARPLDRLPLQLQLEALGCRVEHAHALWHHLLADAIARDGGDAEGRTHERLLRVLASHRS